MISLAAISAILSAFWAKNNVKLIIGALVLVVIAAIGTFIWLDISRRESDAAKAAVHTLEVQQLKDQLAIVRQDQANQIKNQQLLNDRLSKVRDDFQTRVNALSKHDLGAIGAKHPDMLEDRINKATKDQLQRFEEMTK